MRLVLALLVLLGVTAPALADNPLLPVVPVATGEPHPEGNVYWRKHHMDLMRHDRDLTLREGERDIQASIGRCFDCHAVKDEAGQAVSVESDKHFCRVCHDYAAVKVDCFMCHRSTPDAENPNRAMAAADDRNAIAAYLARVAGEASE